MPASIRKAMAAVALAVAGTSVLADNIDLSTVPKRDAVQLTIYNSEDLTLVRETRVVTFKRGANPLQFSWANTLIDPSSVELKFVSHADELEVLDTTFPHEKPQMLYWNVSSEFDGEATIQISYFTSGITWSADYVLIAARDESTASIDGFVRITNNSGEDYEDAQVRLVVGTINLVEKIAQLAQIPMDEVANLGAEEHDRLKDMAAVAAMSRGAGMGGGGMPEEKQIVKEGLSEYFIYTIEGTETVPSGWSKRMRSFDAASVPLNVQYRYRPREYGEQLVRMYLTRNDEESKLGTTPLPDGTVRVFRDNGRDGLSYLVEQSLKYIPIGDKIELNLGADPEVVFELVKRRAARDNFWLQVHGTNTYRQVGRDETQTEENAAVVGWDDRTVFAQRIRNYTQRDIDLEIRRSFEGHVVFRSQLEPALHDFQTVQFNARVPAGDRADLMYEVLQHQGYSAKQSNVTLDAVEVSP